jgi:hypothetical protein
VRDGRLPQRQLPPTEERAEGSRRKATLFGEPKSGNLDTVALAYYRYERIIQEIAAYCEFIFLTREGGQDREQSLRYLQANFQPGGTIELAYRADSAGREFR